LQQLLRLLQLVTPEQDGTIMEKRERSWRKDVMEGINNGIAPDCTTLFNKKHDIYGRVSKSCFRHHLNAYISDYTATMAMKQPPTASCGGSGLLGK
jgi:hypothetical protein